MGGWQKCSHIPILWGIDLISLINEKTIKKTLTYKWACQSAHHRRYNQPKSETTFQFSQENANDTLEIFCLKPQSSSSTDRWALRNKISSCQVDGFLLRFFSSGIFKAEDKLIVHFSFNKFRGTAPDFRKYTDVKNMVIYCVFASTHLESNGSQVTSLKLHNFSNFTKSKGTTVKNIYIDPKWLPLLTGSMNL